MRFLPALILLGACWTYPTIHLKTRWANSYRPDARWKLDRYECERDSRWVNVGMRGSNVETDTALIDKCMDAKGWYVETRWPDGRLWDGGS